MAKTKHKPGHGNKSGKTQGTTTTPPRVRELEKENFGLKLKLRQARLFLAAGLNKDAYDLLNSAAKNKT